MKRNIIFAVIIAAVIMIGGSVYTYTRIASESKIEIPKDVETTTIMMESQTVSDPLANITKDFTTNTVVVTTMPIQTKPKDTKPVTVTPKPTVPPTTEAPTTTEPTVNTEPPTTEPTIDIEPPTNTEPEIEETTPTEPEVELETTEPSSDLVYLGRFKLTAYCGGSCCNGKWAGTTSTGVKPVAGRTIAVDPSVIKYGSKVVINGHTYVAEDCGGGIKGKRIDIFFSSHSAANTFGVQYADVYLKK